MTWPGLDSYLLKTRRWTSSVQMGAAVLPIPNWMGT